MRLYGAQQKGAPRCGALPAHKTDDKTCRMLAVPPRRAATARCARRRTRCPARETLRPAMYKKLHPDGHQRVRKHRTFRSGPLQPRAMSLRGAVTAYTSSPHKARCLPTARVKVLFEEIQPRPTTLAHEIQLRLPHNSDATHRRPAHLRRRLRRHVLAVLVALPLLPPASQHAKPRT